MGGLYDQVVNQASTLEQETYNKSSLVAVSNAIEDVVLEFELEVNMFVFFQREEFFKDELDRYQKLDKLCRNLVLFADKFSQEIKQEFATAEFIDLNHLTDNVSNQLLQEWTVIVQHPQHSMALITQELIEQQIFSQDSFRKFNGFLTFDSGVIQTAVDWLIDLLGSQRPALKLQPLQDEEGEIANFSPQLKQMISLFLNNALNEIESNFNILANQNLMLNHSLEENESKTREIIKRLCFAAEYKDEDTAQHLIRMGFTSTLLYSRVVDKETKLERMFYGSLMHDIGKIGIPDKILFKPGPLTDEEYEEIKQHPKIAVDILRNADHELLLTAREIAYTHHEKWDGSGYPQGLAGEDIPLVGRIVAIADVFDALTAERVYKEAYPLDKALEIMKEGRNSHFDGQLLDIFLANIEAIVRFREEIAAEFNKFDEHETAAHYFKLKPDFTKLKQTELPQFKEVFSFEAD